LEYKRVGGRIKKRKVREFISKHKVEAMTIQESTLGEVDNLFCARLWGGQNVGWKHSTAIGRIDAIITLWDSNKGLWFLLFKDKAF
jgi:hypothetical protein